MVQIFENVEEYRATFAIRKVHNSIENILKFIKFVPLSVTGFSLEIKDDIFMVMTIQKVKHLDSEEDKTFSYKKYNRRSVNKFTEAILEYNRIIIVVTK